MYQCPNCGGALTFDIASQQVKCGYCNSTYNPYSIKDSEDAVQTDYFDTQIFTCKQCGGEVYSVDQEAASFCSFCGSPAMLSSRIANQLRPNYIIPFKVSKDDCKKAYAKKMKYAFFAPKEIKDEKYLNEFRGIYMPYWSYCFSQNISMSINGEKSHRSGDYIITDHYACKADINGTYAGFSYDASSNFYDDISESLAPFDVKQMVQFTPSYLCGFYADTADVDAKVYAEEARQMATDATYQKFVNHQAFNGITMTDTVPAKAALHGSTALTQTDRTMYPVWFLTYQNGDRVAYATVNGQTGKVVADMPIDRKKFNLCSLILAIPLFFLLNAFLTVIPSVMLSIAALLTGLVTFVYASELRSIHAKETNENDLGVISKNATNEAEKAATQLVHKAKKFNCIPVYFIVAAIGFFFLIGADSAELNTMVTAVVCIGTIIAACIGIARNQKISSTGGPIGFLLAIVSILIASAIMFLHPVVDYYYYFGCVASIVTIFYAMMDIIRNYNILSTRQLPQYQKQGGDHRAY